MICSVFDEKFRLKIRSSKPINLIPLTDYEVAPPALRKQLVHFGSSRISGWSGLEKTPLWC
jgi:hypothetical protein